MKTTHDRTVERLPWLVNGTLDADERREVEEHLADCAACRRELAATREAFDLYAAHLPPQVLTAYAEAPAAGRWSVGGAAGEPGATVERGVVEAHLAHCDDCREELEMVRESRAALGLDAGEAAAPPGAETAAPVLPFAAGHRTGGGEAAAASTAPRWHLVALAASVLLALVTAGAWWVESQQVERREARVEALEQQLAEMEEALQQRPAGPDAAGPAPAADGVAGAEPGVTEDQVARLEERLSAMDASLARARQQVARLEREQAAGGLGGIRPDETILVEDMYHGVVRGDGAEVAQAHETGDHRLVVFRITLEGEAAEMDVVPYRVVDSGGTVVERGELSPRPPRDAFASPYLLLPLRTGDLSPGELELQLLAGDGSGRVAKTVPFRVD